VLRFVLSVGVHLLELFLSVSAKREVAGGTAGMAVWYREQGAIKSVSLEESDVRTSPLSGL
jgi:hypothetical protein